FAGSAPSTNWTSTASSVRTPNFYSVNDPSTTLPSSGTNNYAALLGTPCDGAGSTSASGSGSCDRQVVTAGTVDTFNVTMGTTPPNSGETVTFTVMKNGATTPLTCTVTRPATTCSDTTHSATFAAGDWVSVRYVRTSGSFSSTMSFELDNVAS